MPPTGKPPRKRTPHFIEAWRRHAGLTQVQVAEKMKIEQSTVSKLERGLSPYDQDMLEELAAVFKCSPADLISQQPGAPPAAPRRSDGEKEKVVGTKEGPEFPGDYSSAKALERIAAALERLAGAQAGPCDFGAADAFLFAAWTATLVAVSRVNRVDIGLLRGIDHARDTLLANTERFAQNFAANNALLWGARGMGKSALIKAVHASINAQLAGSPGSKPLKLVEIHREDIGGLPRLMALLRGQPWRFVVICDDLSFDAADSSYKSLKAALEGGIEGRPGNVLFYATSNRRHILPREMIENERRTAINPDDAVQEKTSLSDRFGLWLGFHPCSQDDYLAMVFGYAEHFGLSGAREKIEREALEWALARGSRSGRTAWQFIQDLAGRLGKAVE
jgi:predicted AAA+ superfamily ATPase/DNA-binding XRE family transcriptional regulator